LNTADDREHGVLKYFYTWKGYSFLAPDNSAEPDVFVHVSAVGNLARAAARPAASVGLLRVGWRMQPHEQHDPKPDPPKPKEPDPRDERAKWLLFAIAVLLGLVASQIAKRLI
jgi:hypothetical protein